ncbi:related to bifunctional 4-hydroxyphenylacetate degradation enzyme [Fusarium torulosum]|uniref:Related to bifunctional 4-hydroxyphenylacetate degradation enzyme n=1 Tax=Fusarium torulosum TaxID=33205 RepID=A0AAE8MD87_9HYPO|nr:related to bifunctional 4-hydroxyphenylacetate degradation enzyme [Fusarium torulosum]
MPPFYYLVRFLSADDNQIYFADLGVNGLEQLGVVSQVDGYASVDGLIARHGGRPVRLGKILAPVPQIGVPIYCVGLNYRSHAEEAKLAVTQHPPLWTKPAAALAAPYEDIVMNEFCASSLPDYEGELVFVTSRACRDVNAKEAQSCILGYTVGNDISCRLYQLPEQCGRQFYFAKAFDKFAPIGPTLVHPDVIGQGEGLKLITRLNGETVQEAELMKDLIWKPAEILSWMSQGTTIPAGTAVMTGTPAGVGVFKNPRRLLTDSDVVEVEIPNVGVLRNKIVFE